MILLIYVFNYFIYLACGEAGEGKGSVGEGLGRVRHKRITLTHVVLLIYLTICFNLFALWGG